jgi:hypothetical protein
MLINILYRLLLSKYDFYNITYFSRKWPDYITINYITLKDKRITLVKCDTKYYIL